MNGEGAFLDSNMLLYLRSGDVLKAEIIEDILRMRPLVSIQVLNEFASVSRRKFRREWSEIVDALQHIKAICRVLPLTLAVHERGLALAAAHGFTVYDAMIVAAAESGNCFTLYSEDMQDGRKIGGVTIRNPFK